MPFLHRQLIQKFHLVKEILQFGSFLLQIFRLLLVSLSHGIVHAVITTYLTLFMFLCMTVFYLIRYVCFFIYYSFSVFFSPWVVASHGSKCPICTFPFEHSAILLSFSYFVRVVYIIVSAQ